MADTSDSTDLWGILASASLGDLELKTVPQMKPADSAHDAVQAMRKTKHGSVLVSREGKVVGIFTERDWLRLLSRDGDVNAALSEVMTADPKTLTADHLVSEAVQLMEEGGYRRVPVVDNDHKALGIVDVKTIVHLLVEHFPAAIYNQASSDQLTARSREGA